MQYELWLGWRRPKVKPLKVDAGSDKGLSS